MALFFCYMFYCISALSTIYEKHNVYYLALPDIYSALRKYYLLASYLRIIKKALCIHNLVSYLIEH